jgi:hypothetical protein
MAELTYPYYQFQADGPNETGFSITVKIGEGAGGPLPGMTVQSVLDELKRLLAGDSGDVTVRLSSYDITVTNNL